MIIGVVALGIPEVVKNLGKISENIKQTSINTLPEVCNIIKDNIKENIIQLNAIDTETLMNSLDKEKVNDYFWWVGDYHYPGEVPPYAVYVEYGFQRHFVPRHYFEIPGKLTNKLAWFLDMQNPTFRRMGGRWVNIAAGLTVGPMPPRPVFFMGMNVGGKLAQEYYANQLKRAIGI